MLMFVCSIIGISAGTITDISGFLKYDSELVCIAGQTQEYDFAGSIFSNIGKFNINYSNIALVNHNRPLFSIKPRDIYVNISGGGNYTTIQEAVNQIPYFLNHRYRIFIAEGIYNEDIKIPAFILSDITDLTEGSVSGLQMGGATINSGYNVKIKSMSITTAIGAVNEFRNMHFYGVDPNSDENVSVSIYGGGVVAFRRIHFNESIAKHGFLPYSASINVMGLHFGNNLEYGFYVKHGGRVDFNNDYLEYSDGNLSEAIVRLDSGDFFINNDYTRINSPKLYYAIGDHTGVTMSQNNSYYELHQVNKLSEENIYLNNIHSNTLHSVSNQNKIGSFNFNSESISNNKILDSTSNDNYAISNNVKFNNNVSYLGNSAEFNGNSYVDFNDKINNISAFSLWVNFNESQENIQGDIMDGRTGSKRISLIYRSNNKIAINLDDGNGNQDITGIINLGDWYHISGIYNKTHWNFYTNGILDKSVNVIGNFNVESLGVSASDFNSYFLKGNIDEVIFWNESITEKEIKNIYLQHRESINPYLSKSGGTIYDDVTIKGDLTVEGNIIQEQVGLYGSLIAPNSTTITTAGTYYSVNGIFDNTPAEGFFYNATANAVQYNSTTPRYIELDISMSLQGSTTGMTPTMTIKKNGIVQTKGSFSIYLKVANEPYSVASTTVVPLELGDQLQIIATSDGNGDVITLNSMEITARAFCCNS